jgi:hypothetical protein
MGEIIKIADASDLKIETQRREEEAKGMDVCRREIKNLD